MRKEGTIGESQELVLVLVKRLGKVNTCQGKEKSHKHFVMQEALSNIFFFQTFNLTTQGSGASQIPILAPQWLPSPQLPRGGGSGGCAWCSTTAQGIPRDLKGSSPWRSQKSILFPSISLITSQPWQLNYKSFLPQRIADTPNLISNLW